MQLPCVQVVIIGVYRAVRIERLMAPYVFAFMIDADSLLLGIVLGAVGMLGVVMIIKNF